MAIGACTWPINSCAPTLQPGLLRSQPTLVCVHGSNPGQIQCSRVDSTHLTSPHLTHPASDTIVLGPKACPQDMIRRRAIHHYILSHATDVLYGVRSTSLLIKPPAYFMLHNLGKFGEAARRIACILSSRPAAASTERVDEIGHRIFGSTGKLTTKIEENPGSTP
jgi:hypothetical protein